MKRRLPITTGAVALDRPRPLGTVYAKDFSRLTAHHSTTRRVRRTRRTRGRLVTLH